MKKHLLISAALVFLVLMGSIAALSRGDEKNRQVVRGGACFGIPEKDPLKGIEEGRQTFRFDTFGDEAFWGDALKLHQAIAGAKLGGVGPGLSPESGAGSRLKVDMRCAAPGTSSTSERKQSRSR